MKEGSSELCHRLSDSESGSRQKADKDRTEGDWTCLWSTALLGDGFTQVRVILWVYLLCYFLNETLLSFKSEWSGTSDSVTDSLTAVSLHKLTVNVMTVERQQ